RAAGHSGGAEVGRRSYYGLPPAAGREFQAASYLSYAPVRPAPPLGWHLVLLPDDAPSEATARLSRLRFGLLHQKLALLPDRGQALPSLPPCHLRASGADDLGPALRSAWPLEDLAAQMNAFLSGFSALETHEPSADQAIGLRLLLVHVFRRIALADPLLPPDCLPADWPGERARHLFARLYARLSPMAEASVAHRFRDRHGLLRLDPGGRETRLARMTGGGAFSISK
ncbi:PaaX family transcriptional regulator C-terminal domain-containing protein, partial [Aureimonas ureilytica]|uniref:PaaX family transcriptional regulator C-terminal domain-containing protein n=1 Tax=Aureimonas ureilytica TaxID=401562 RepID=UPI00073432DE